MAHIRPVSLLVVFALISCQPVDTGGGNKHAAQLLTSADTAACHADYGEVITVGFNAQICQRPAMDAGISCESGYDCQGFCLAQEKATPGMETTGVCSENDVMFGCFDVVENGETATLCVD